jgi:type II secretory pathway component PulK
MTIARVRRRGFVLITVLWVLVAASVAALAGALSGRESFDAGRNRVSAARAYWRAQGCAEKARYAVDALLRTASAGQVRDSVWRSLDSLVAQTTGSGDAECSHSLEAAGSRLDANAAGEGQLLRLFAVLGIDDVAGHVDALLDWIDEDDAPRSSGVESSWYGQAARIPPRNAHLGSVAELQHVRGFEGSSIESVIDVEPGRISIATASPTVLAAVPGFTPEARQRVAEWRAERRQISNLLVFAASLSSQSADSIVAYFPEISRVATLDPDAWIIRGVARSGLPTVSSVVELRLVRADERAAVARRRVWR